MLSYNLCTLTKEVFEHDKINLNRDKVSIIILLIFFFLDLYHEFPFKFFVISTSLIYMWSNMFVYLMVQCLKHRDSCSILLSLCCSPIDLGLCLLWCIPEDGYG